MGFCGAPSTLRLLMTPSTGFSGQATRVMSRVTSYSSVASVRGLKPGIACSASPQTATRPK